MGIPQVCCNSRYCRTCSGQNPLPPRGWWLDRRRNSTVSRGPAACMSVAVQLYRRVARMPSPGSGSHAQRRSGALHQTPYARCVSAPSMCGGVSVLGIAVVASISAHRFDLRRRELSRRLAGWREDAGPLPRAACRGAPSGRGEGRCQQASRVVGSRSLQVEGGVADQNARRASSCCIWRSQDPLTSTNQKVVLTTCCPVDTIGACT